MNRNTTGSGTITLVNEPDPVKEIPPAITRYLNFLEAELDSTNNVGAALTIVVRDEVLVTRTYGLRKSDEVAKINEHTVFRLASVSKGFAGVLACILEQDSVFSLQDKVLTYLPGFRLKDSVNTLDLTIKNTLSHTSGLVPHAFDNLIEDGVPLNVIIQQLPFADISAPPGLLYGYQNVIFSLVDTIIRNRTEKSYAEILHEKIFDPLDMQDASATPQVFERKRSNIAYPHAYSGDGYKPLALNLGYYNIAPAAGVNASVSDLGKWLLALLGNRTDILDSTILGKITDPVVNSPLKLRYIRNWDKIDQKFYSLGWRIYMYKGYKIIYHGGYVSGYRAEIAFCPEAGIGMAFVQNSPNRVASMCVPVFFNTWFAVGDSLSPDTGKDTIPPEYKFFDDTLY
jgi:beta-lactamase class C